MSGGIHVLRLHSQTAVMTPEAANQSASVSTCTQGPSPKKCTQRCRHAEEESTNSHRTGAALCTKQVLTISSCRFRSAVGPKRLPKVFQNHTFRKSTARTCNTHININSSLFAEKEWRQHFVKQLRVHAAEPLKLTKKSSMGTASLREVLEKPAHATKITI